MLETLLVLQLDFALTIIGPLQSTYLTCNSTDILRPSVLPVINRRSFARLQDVGAVTAPPNRSEATRVSTKDAPKALVASVGMGAPTRSGERR